MNVSDSIAPAITPYFHISRFLRRPLRLFFALSTLTALVAVAPRSFAQDVSAKFPEPAQVTADYPDDVERWGAFNVLSHNLTAMAPRPLSKAAYNKSFAYDAAYNQIVSTYLAKGAQSQANKDFSARCNELFAKPGFGASVLEKYHLAAAAKQKQQDNVAAAAAASNAAAATAARNAAVAAVLNPPPQRTIFAPNTPDRNFLNDPWPYPQSFPLLLFFLLPVAFFTWLALRGSGAGRKVLPVPPPEPNGLPALPESLRVVTVPGVRYAVYVLSGMVLQKEENVSTESSSTTTGGSATQIGGQLHFIPAQTTSWSRTTREEIIWVRTPGNSEKPWTLYNSQFQSRPGQIVSVLVRPLTADTGDIILAFNHATGVMEICPAMRTAHGTGGFLRREFVQWTANFVAAAGSAFVTRRYLPMFYHGSLYAGFLVWWLFGAVALVTLSFLIVTPFLTSRVRKKRDAAFQKKYMPGLRQFFEQGTLILQNTFRRG